ncbi:MAG: preprotein translocase subunit SecG [Gammaproteobacteria bacterium]|nr:preprotein translocase subunit SecG [Gammaproteobacteria bacterium]
MEQIILIVHLLIALAIIGLIMLQQGKGADMGASFGAGGSQTLFGADGSGNVLTKATALLVVAFFATSFGLAVIAKDKAATVSDAEIPLPLVEQQEAPAEIQDIPAVDADLPAEMVGEDDIPNVD